MLDGGSIRDYAKPPLRGLSERGAPRPPTIPHISSRRKIVCDGSPCFCDMEQPVRKRRRPAVACTECRRRKVKCDRTLPCASCVLGTLPCAYNSPNVPTQNLRSSTDAGFHWSSMPNIVVTDINLQRFYGNSIENLETPTLPPSDTDHHGLDGPSVARYRATILGTSVEGVDAVSESSDVSNMSPPRTSVQDAPTSIKSSMSRGTHLTPNHWKDVFKEVCRRYRESASVTELTS